MGQGVDRMISETCSVQVPGRDEGSYEVRIGTGILETALAEVREWMPHARIFVVTDRNVNRHGHLAALLGTSHHAEYIIDPPGEHSKNMQTVQSIVDRMEELGYGRDSLVLAMGGGTVGDAAGFAASIFKRGVPCIHLPTTTLSQADSAIGGKTGVDSPLSKNAYGTFHHPIRVYMDCSTLLTLDERSFRAGLAESVKHGMIADGHFFAFLERSTESILKREEPALAQLARKNSAIKGAIVYQDPYEENLRCILNYGHTIGHAVETASGLSLLHGEAVAIGIAGACRIAERLGIADQHVGRRARDLLERLCLPTEIPAGIPTHLIREHMKRDKKALQQVPRFVLLEEIGRVHAPDGRYATTVAPEVVERTISELQSII